MSAIENWFNGVVESFLPGGGNRTNLLGVAAQRSGHGGVAQLGLLPAEIDSKMVQEEARLAEAAEGQVALAQEFSKFRQQRMNAGARLHGIVAQHDMSTMRTQQQMTETDLKFGKAQIMHNHKLGVAKSRLSGYDAAFENAVNGFNF